jgi:hypothetical protein
MECNVPSGKISMMKNPYDPPGFTAFQSKSVQRRLAISRKEGRPMVVQLVEQLKSFDVERVQLDELLALAAFGKLLRTERESRGLDSPDWLDDRLRTLNREIESRRRDTLELRLKQAKAQAATLLTPTERREKVQAEITALEKQLAETK